MFQRGVGKLPEGRVQDNTISSIANSICQRLCGHPAHQASTICKRMFLIWTGDLNATVLILVEAP